MMSIILHHYKMLKEQTSSFDGFYNSSNDDDNNEDDINANNNIDSTILKQEFEKWYNFSFVLRKPNRILFKEINLRGNTPVKIFYYLLRRQNYMIIPMELH